VTDLAIVSGGLAQPSSTRLLADRLGAAVRDALADSGHTVSTTVVELRPLAHQIIDAALSGFAPPDLEAAFEVVSAADGLIAVSPAFNASYSGLFKSFFDALPSEALTDLPVLLGATGGTERHSLMLDHALRPLFTYLRAVVAPTGVYAATADFGADDEGSAPLDARIARAAQDLARLLGDPRPRRHRDAWDEDVGAMRHLLTTRHDGVDDARHHGVS
jgi:FMN reductase